MAEKRFQGILERHRSALSTYQAPPSLAALLSLPSQPGNGVITIISCSDARVEPTDFLKMQKGDATVIRNAGARVTNDVFRSLSVMGTIAPIDFIAISHHTDCGGLFTTDEDVSEKLALRKPEHAHLIKEKSFGTFASIGLDESVRQDVAKLKDWPFLPSATIVRGYALDLDTGAIREVRMNGGSL